MAWVFITDTLRWIDDWLIQHNHPHDRGWEIVVDDSDEDVRVKVEEVV